MDPKGRPAMSGNTNALVVALGIVAAGSVITARYERRSAPTDPKEVLVHRPLPPDHDMDFAGAQPLPALMFRPGSADLGADERGALDPVIAALTSDPHVVTLEIMGFAEARGGVAGSRALSRRRADAVRDHLVSRGIDEGRLEACPYGPARSVSLDDDDGGHAQHNRVSVLVLSRTAPAVLTPTPVTPTDPPRPCPKPPPPVGAALVFGDQDRDEDGVPNSVDHCPSDPRSARRDPRQPRCAGCLRADLDRDGVYDDDDLCRTVGAGEHPDQTRPGCPDGDVDGDRVFDSHDACRDETPGPLPDPARPGCPAPDRDDDSIADARDRCPDTPMGLQPDATRAGCPVPDRDGDTVPDAVDGCINEIGAPSTTAAQNGCPGLVGFSGGSIALAGPLTFARGATRWDAASTATLNALADAVLASRWVYRVAVIAHADHAPLALRRAEAIADWMVARGVAPCDVEAFGRDAPTDGAHPDAVGFRLRAQMHPWNVGLSPRSAVRYDGARER